MKRNAWVFLACVLALPAAAAEGPAGIENARIEVHGAAAGLEPVFRALVARTAGPAWIAYAAPVAGRHQMCCWDSVDEASSSSCCGGCRLERKGGAFHSRSGAAGPVPLEASGRFRVLFRIGEGRVERVRTFSETCALDAGGLPFFWLSDVRPADSLRLLATFVGTADEGKRRHGTEDGALAAIAMHADAGADSLLEGFAAPARPEHTRKQAAFWLGNARGHRGFLVLKRMVRDDPSDRFREHAIFALTQSSEEEEAVDVILETARRDQSAKVRGQALFWLAQKAGRKATAAINRAIDEDPETEVKKKAVFALSQLPKDEGVPLLIQTARQNRNPEVRKQAMFWLGQSKDPRALAFFEDVLKR